MSGTVALVDSGHETCVAQRLGQVLLIDTVGRRGKNGRVEVGIPDSTVVCWCLAKSTTTAILLLLPDCLTSKESLTNRNSIVHLHSIDL